MREIRLTIDQLKELVDTYGNHVEEMDRFLNIETGDIVILSRLDDSIDYEELSEKIDEGFNEIYFRVPYRDSNEGFSDMEDFTRTVANERLQIRLWDALNGGRGVFRRFKDTLAYDVLEQERYYNFLEERSLERIMQWLEDIGVKPTIVM